MHFRLQLGILLFLGFAATILVVGLLRKEIRMIKMVEHLPLVKILARGNRASKGVFVSEGRGKRDAPQVPPCRKNVAWLAWLAGKGVDVLVFNIKTPQLDRTIGLEVPLFAFGIVYLTRM